MKKMVISVIVLQAFAMMLFVRGVGASSPSKPQKADEKWEYYASDEEGTAYHYNPGKMKHLPDGLVRVWVKAVYPESNLKFLEGKLLWEINCARKTMRGIEAHTKKKDGATVTLTEPSDWADIPSESTGETLFGIVCLKMGEKKK